MKSADRIPAARAAAPCACGRRLAFAAAASILIAGSAASADTIEAKIMGQPTVFERDFLLRPCLDALVEESAKDGLEVDIRPSLANWKAQESDTNFHVWIKHDAEFTGFYGPPATTLPSVFSGPEAYASVLKEMTKGQLKEICRNNCMDYTAVLGVAYAGSAQLFTADAPLVEPEHLDGRTVIVAGPVNHEAFSRTADVQVEIDDVLEPASMTTEDTRYELEGNLKWSSKTHAIMAPTIFAEAMIPADMREYMSVTMSQISSIWFSGHAKYSHILSPIIERAALRCSSHFYDKELKAVEDLKKGGTKVVSANIPGFRARIESALEARLEACPKKERRQCQEELDGYRAIVTRQ